MPRRHNVAMIYAMHSIAETARSRQPSVVAKGKLMSDGAGPNASQYGSESALGAAATPLHTADAANSL